MTKKFEMSEHDKRVFEWVRSDTPFNRSDRVNDRSLQRKAGLLRFDRKEWRWRLARV